MPTYTIFAGVNGCGKTSIYKSTYYEQNKGEKRINIKGIQGFLQNLIICFLFKR